MRQNFQQSASDESRISIYDQVTGRFIELMEQGRVPWVEPHATGTSGFALPKSAATGKPFSAINILILWDAAATRGYLAQEWLTFRQAVALGGSVRKGERGTAACYADSFIPKAERQRAAHAGSDPNRVPFHKRFSLFNIAQCEGLPAPKAAAPPCNDLWTASDALLAATGAVLREGAGADYDASADCIRMASGAAFPSTQAYLATLLYELARWTGHPARLNRNLKRFGDSAPVREDLIAELASAFLSAHFGAASQLRHPDHLPRWLALLKTDNRAIFHAASQASKASDFLLSRKTLQAGRAA